MKSKQLEQIQQLPDYSLTREKYPKYRVRRGKVVKIPDEWRGKMTTRKTIKLRPSKHPKAVHNPKNRRRQNLASDRVDFLDQLED